MPLRRFLRQYEQLSQFEKGRIIGMMEAVWSARREARQLGRSDCVARKCWDQWIGRDVIYAKTRFSTPSTFVRFPILHGSHSVFGYPDNRVSERCPVPTDSDKRRSTVTILLEN
ncbi:transposable element Tcb2 transposase [Trichonephila clavipes]|nr:transposable element Tcb2 transposase [Trichonephila clavipes]